MNLTGQVRGARELSAWLADGGLREDRELVLWSAELDDDAAFALAGCPEAGLLHALDLSHNHLTAIGVEALARALPSVARLRLYHNALGPAGAAAVAAGGWRLRSLNLCGNAIGAAGVAALRGPLCRSLEALHLGWDELGDAGLAALAAEPWPALVELNVRANELRDIAPLLAGGFPALARLGLDDNPLGDDGLAALLATPAFRQLTWLNLTATELTERALALLATVDAPNLRELRIGENALSEDAVDALPALAHCDATERTWEVTLAIAERGGETREVVLRERSISLGRVTGNTIVLPKGNVSKRHCRIDIDKQGRAVVADCRSTNGMWFNGSKLIAPRTMTPADTIFVGDFAIRLVGEPRRVD